jgi:tetratricopeptide (TPR) repeat protein
LNVCFGRGEPAAAFPIAQESLELAEVAKAGLDQAHCNMGQTLAAMGEFASALGHFQLVVDNHRAGKRDVSVRLLVDESVLALAYSARILWALGYPARAADAAHEAIALARRRANPPTLATALVGRLFLAVHGLPLGQAAAQAREAFAYCKEHELVHYERWFHFLHGALLAQEGDAAAGIERMQSAVSAAEASQNRQFRPFQLTCIGTAYAKLGNAALGLTILEEAASIAEAGGEKQSLATVYRHRGEILSGLGQNRDAADAFESAWSVARRQGARLEELRAAIAIMRHATSPYNAASARRTLEDVYATFDKRHAFPDLQAARDLLNA